jgi:hypothetical protein
MFARHWCLVFVLLSLSLLIALPQTPASVSGEEESSDSSYEIQVNAALRSSTDLWGERLMARPEGPTYDNLIDQLPSTSPGLETTRRYATPDSIHGSRPRFTAPYWILSTFSAPFSPAREKGWG